jgi:primosomal protein N' (replication factor Y)
MRCHSCDFSSSPPSICPECGVSELVFRSIGTKALETELQRLYPKARIGRFDRDTEKLDRLHKLHSELQTGKIEIIIGTQAIVKGFDLPKLSVVGIINADSGLQIPDFTASERSFQLISQVSGRIGRGHRAGKLFVQSYQPDNPLLKMALEKNYAGFMEQELLQRQNYKFPPYYYLLKITCSRASAKSAQSTCDKLASDIRQSYGNVIIEGPTPRFVEKKAGRYAWHIIVKSHNRKVLTDITVSLPGSVTYDLDPSDLL